MTTNDRFERAATLGAFLGDHFNRDPQRMADELGLVVSFSADLRPEIAVYYPPGVGGWSRLLLSTAVSSPRIRDSLIAACCGAQIIGPVPAAPFVVRLQRHPVGVTFATAFLGVAAIPVQNLRVHALRSQIA